MKRNLLLFFLFLSASLMASDICIDGIWYKFYGDEAEVTYQDTGKYAYAEHTDRYKDSLIIPATVTYQSKTYTVTAIDSFATYNCDKLTYVEMPATIQKIEWYGFYFASLVDIVIPDGVEEIEGYAFADMFYQTLKIGKSLKKIDISALAGSSQLTKIEVSTCNPYYTSGDQCNAIIERATGRLVLGCKNTTVPTYVKTIGGDAFYWCLYLTSIELPNVEYIETSAFNSCIRLEEINLGRSLQYIEGAAFDDCNALTKIVSYNTTPPNLESTTMPFGADFSPEVIQVPKNAVGAYESAAGWEELYNYEGIDVPAAPTPDVMPDVYCPETDLEEFITAPMTTKSQKYIQNGHLYITTENAIYNASGNVITNN